MRTTLTLDDDLAGLLKRRAQELGISFRGVVNQTICAGLEEAAAARSRPAPKTIPHSFGFRPGIDLDKLGQLTDELEAEAFTEKNAMILHCRHGRFEQDPAFAGAGSARQRVSSSASRGA